jgi:hypothetical protein
MVLLPEGLRLPQLMILKSWMLLAMDAALGLLMRLLGAPLRHPLTGWAGASRRSVCCACCTAKE